MTTMIGWRTKGDEVSPHYYREDDTGSGADAISLCEKFYAFHKDMNFPGPSMAFCSECEEIFLKTIARGLPIHIGPDTKVDLTKLDHHDYYLAAVKALDDGINRDDETDLSKEQSCFLIALVDIAIALYLLFAEKE